MNIMRKFLSQGSASLPSPTNETSPGSLGPAGSGQQELLGLSHLKKLFSDYQSPPHPLSDSEKEGRLYMMLPLFCKVFGSSPPRTVSECFPEAPAFAQVASRLLVTEVRRRASNQSTEEAAGAIATFMEINETSEESSNGWMLLSALNVLGAEGEELSEVMTSASVPSTLVKCLYLFFDLSPTVDGTEQNEAEFTKKERRILLQKMFIQVLLRLCTHIPAVEELARKDDLTLLFSAVTSGCPPQNSMWRKTAADILLTISRHSLSQPVVSYLHNKGCIALCVENMQRSSELSPLESVEMFVTVFCFLKDSSQDSQTLLDDFRTCQGYIFLSEFLLKLEQSIENEAEANEAIRNLVLLVASLSFCGHIEMKTPCFDASTSLYQMDSFKMPVPDNRGSTVRNLQAVQVLQSVFLKAKSEQLTGTILDAISTIYTADNANYFLLESQNTLSQFAEKISLKPKKAQEKFFQLLEFLVHHLKFVPCKELISVSLLLKSKQNKECCSLALQSLSSIIKFDQLFKNVFREVGMVEVFVELLQNYADFRKSEAILNEDSRSQATILGELAIQDLCELLTGCSANAAVFRDYGGAKTTIELIKLDCGRESALHLMHQFILASGRDEDMTLLLDVLHTSPHANVEIKSDILHTLVACLRESHRSRAVFRRVGGFIYTISVLVSLEGSLSHTPKDLWKEADERKIFTLLRAVFSCLTVAMRYEPANANYFQVEMNCGQSMVETIKLLGCFSSETALKSVTRKPKEEFQEMFHEIFTTEVPNFQKYQTLMTKPMFSSFIVLRMLYDMAVDNYEKNRSPGIITLPKSPSSKNAENLEFSDAAKAKNIPTLNLTPIPPDPVIVHSGIVTTILKVMPSLYFEEKPEVSIAMQLYTAEMIKSLLRTEKNQQIMCDVSFVSDILIFARSILEDEAHVLHSPFQYMMERLSSQKLEPKDLRIFLRLGNPLACLNDDERQEKYAEIPANQKPGSFIPLTRVKTLVSMTTPRDLHVQNNSILPPFIEMDMSPEGFGCLYLPSLAPYNPFSSAVGVGTLASQEVNVIGGIGHGDRPFPPQPGLSFSTWVCIDKFSDPRSDPHPVRLLTISRQLKGSEEHETYVCLSVCLSARDKALIVSTQETVLSRSSDWQPDFSGDHGARIWFPDLIKEGEWHHLVVVLNRQVLKNSSFSLFVNGQHIVTQRMQYICQTPGGGVTTTTVSSTVQAFIGTSPQWRRHSRLCWKQGPCLMFEDVASPQLASLLYKLGPHYLGSLQAPQIATTGEVLTSQINEEKILFGLNAVAVSQMTLAKIRKVYSRVDNKAIAKQLGMSATENATPFRIIHNSAGHLLGPARSLGGVIIGYLGVRCFTPQPVSKVIETVGGCNVMLGIIAMARDTESLYAGVKALVCVLKSNPFSRCEMETNKGYQTLAMLLRKKVGFLNSHILYLMFTMAGTIDPGKEVVGIPNVAAFRDVLCDLELWHEAPSELEKSLFEHFYELLADTSMQRNGAKIRTLREFSLVDKLLGILKKSECSNSTTLTLLNVIHALLCTNPRVTDVLCFALFTAATLNPTAMDEKFLELNKDGTEFENSGGKTEDPELGGSVILRNRCLKLFFSLLYNGKKIHTKYCEDVVQVVGFDWILLFFQGHLHPSTVVWGLRLLMTLLSMPNLLDKFRMGTCNGHWLLKSDIVLQNKMVQALGQTSTTTSRATKKGIRQDIFNVPGFQLFNWLMPQHIEIPETYFLIIAMLLGQPVKNLPENVKLDLDSVWNYIFGASAADTSYSDIADKVNLSGDAIITIMCMVRAMLNCEVKNPEKLPIWLKEYPVTLTQVICYLYHNVLDFMPVFMTEDVLTSLVGTLFPTITSSATPTPGDSVPSSPHQVTNNAGTSDALEREGLGQKGDLQDCLSNHPAKRNIMNFMRVMIVDSLSLQATPKSPPIIDLLLDAKPENTTHAQQCRFQTELLGIVMDHLLAADVLIGDQAALPIVQGGNSQYIAPNVFYLASRLVDKLWQGVFKKDPDEVFQFTLKLISQAKRRSGTGTSSLEGIYRCLNRTILYLLSRPHSDVKTHVTVLEVLQNITTNRSIIFGAGNHELEFFGCLTFCLLQILAGHKIPTDGETKTQWHVQPSEGDDVDQGDAASNFYQDKARLSTAANKVWDELYVCKRPALEEVFKTSFGTQNETPPLETIRNIISDQSCKVWFTYVDMEKKATYSRTPAWEFHTQLESRIQRITGGFAGGLKRLTSVTGSSGSSNKPKKEDSLAKVEYSNLPRAIIEQATLNHIAIVKEVVDLHYKNRHQTDQHMLKYTEEEWLQTEANLTQERGLWGPFYESPLTKWMLDLTEGPARRRQRLIRNDVFYLHYPYRVNKDAEEKPLKYKRPTSLDSKLWYEQHQSLTMFEREEERFVELEYDDCDVTVQDKSLTIDEQMRKIGFQGLKHAIGQATVNKVASENDDDGDVPSQLLEKEDSAGTNSPSSPELTPIEPTSPTLIPIEEESSDYQTVMRLLENGESITHMYRCARIQGLDTAEGLLLFGKEHFYILDGFTLVNGREVHDIEYIPANRYEPIIPIVPGQVSRMRAKRQVNKFSFDNIKEVHKRRYLLQPIAVEIFSTDGQNHLLAFTKQIRPKVYQRLLSAAPSISDNAQHSVAGQRRSANVEQSSGLLSSLMGETSVTQRWVRGEITNFQYLMALNTLAGRSYNDLMQYPVFPWVLADYRSEELDLTNPSTFRDLSKPMGAQTLPRLEQFRRRYQDWDDPHNDTPPYHYGTHYSSAMIVSSFLVRLEPFTQHFLHLQGGHFDLADRMFHSVVEAWESASKNNMADLRELIPEFFYLPDFLENRNKFDLGMKQNGEVLSSVILPPWAKNSPTEFIRVHREALESEFVSSHLHEWIDLIFGFKQQGQAAEEAVNVFHHLFYEGNVDIFSIEDPLQRNATIGFINNFGQIPKQLFKKPHPAKKLQRNSNGMESAPAVHMNSKVFFHHLTNLRPSMTPIKELKGPVGQIYCVDRVVYAVEQNKVLVPGNSNRYLAWGYADQSFRLGNYESDKAVFICEPNYLIGQVLTCVCPNAKVVLTAGTSTVVAVYEYHKKLRQLLIKKMLYGHTDAVTCLAASPGWNIAVSGSRDRTAIIWDLSRYCYVKHLSGHAGPIAAVTINELTGDIVTCAGSWLYLWDINGRLQASVNTAVIPGNVQQPHQPAQQVLCICCSQYNEWNRENVIMTGSSDGVVRMWSVDYVEVAAGEEEDKKKKDEEAPIAEDPLSEVSGSIAHFAKKMSLSMSGDCLSSLREAIAQSRKSEMSDPSSDTEGEDIETEDQEEAKALAQATSPVSSNESSETDKTTSLPPVETPTICVTNEDFVVVSQEDVKKPAVDEGASGSCKNDGYTWTKRLVFRAKLTMHTAFERADNVDPAAVTALAVSKDHRTIYVGDEKGRVFSWAVSSKPGKGMVDHWCKDEGSEACIGCGVKFTIYERRHHCRACGKLFCSSCSQYQSEIPRLKILQKVRVCKACFDALQSETQK